MGKGCKVVVCGQAAVGKTAILEHLLYGNHSVGEYCTRDTSVTQLHCYTSSDFTRDQFDLEMVDYALVEYF